MKLKIKDRINLSQILPQEGDYVTLCVTEDLNEKLRLSQDELKEYEVTATNGFVKWNTEGEKYEKDIKITSVEKDVIVEKLKKINEEKKLNTELLPTYRKFIK